MTCKHSPVTALRACLTQRRTPRRHVSPEQLSDDDAWPQPRDAHTQPGTPADLRSPSLPAGNKKKGNVQTQDTAQSPLRLRLRGSLAAADAAAGHDTDAKTPHTQHDQQEPSLQSAMWQACLSPAEAQDICALLGLRSPAPAATPLSPACMQQPASGLGATEVRPSYERAVWQDALTSVDIHCAPRHSL